MPDEPARRCVLLLQGPRSGFLRHLAAALEARGARVLRVLVCPGDHLFWGRRPAIRYRGRPADWPAFVARLIAAEGVTDIVGLGDGRPLHADGFAAARTTGVRVHVMEQGYLRPGWLTLETGALGTWRPPATARSGPPPVSTAPRGAGFWHFAAMDIAHHVSTLGLGWLLYPHHRRHELHPAPLEWLAWLLRFARGPARRRADRAARARIAAATGPVFLLALQLDSDFQMRRHGPPGGVRAVLALVTGSFAEHAPPDALLVIRPHPLDPWLTDWAAVLEALPLPPSVRRRILWLHGGDPLGQPWTGIVTVNSTLGLAALMAGYPVIALGRAVYGQPGLVHDGPLEGFWHAPQPPDPSRLASFVTALVEETQVQGSFDGAGMALGADGMASRILRGEP